MCHHRSCHLCNQCRGHVSAVDDDFLQDENGRVFDSWNAFTISRLLQRQRLDRRQLPVHRLEHSPDVTQVSVNVPSILDGHHSHKTVAAVGYARNHASTMIALPPHYRNRMQPLDRTYFKSLESSYTAA